MSSKAAGIIRKLGISVLICISALSCNNRTERKSIPVKKVKTAIASASENYMTEDYPARVVSASEANLSFRIAGPIEKIHVVQGQHVKKGDLLAVMQQRDYKLQYSATEAEYLQIKAEAERAMELYKRGSASKSDYDKAYYGLTQITAKYNAHKNALGDTELRAPYDGYVTKINFRENEIINAGMPVMRIVSDGAPEMEVHISAHDYVKRAQMEGCSCSIDAFPESTFPLQLIDISGKANLNQLFTMKLAIDPSPKGELPSPGMAGIVSIKYRTASAGNVEIPLSAIFGENDRSYVWVVDNGKVSRRSIVVSNIDRKGRATVSQGLNAGETVVSAGTHSLTEGAEVKEI